MLKVEVQSDEVTSRAITSKDGKPLTIRNQNAYIHGLEGYPQRIQLSLWDRPGYAVGFYTISPESYRVNRFNNLELTRSLVLVPVAK